MSPQDRRAGGTAEDGHERRGGRRGHRDDVDADAEGQKRRDDRAIITVPLAFTGASVSVAVPFLRCGGSLVIRHEFVPARVLDDIEDNGVTFIGVVPLILERMAAEPDFARRDLSGLRVAKVGGAAVPEHLIRIYNDRGVGLVNAYALTRGPDSTWNSRPTRRCASSARSASRCWARRRAW